MKRSQNHQDVPSASIRVIARERTKKLNVKLESKSKQIGTESELICYQSAEFIHWKLPIIVDLLMGDRIKSHKTCDYKTMQRQTTVSEANRRQEQEQSECYDIATGKFSANSEIFIASSENSLLEVTSLTVKFRSPKKRTT